MPAVLDHNMQLVEDSSVALYFVTEWIDGKNLHRYIGGRPCSIEEALGITRELAEIGARCHSVGVCHRDIKPDNVIVSSEDRGITLVDFGTAFAEPDSSEFDFKTEGAQGLGNRFLRIPDLSAGQADRRDPRSDVTFLVGILFFLLTGRAPRSLVDQEMRAPHHRSTNLFTDATTLDSRWTLVRRILEVGFQPAANFRFQSAETLLDRIDEVLNPVEGMESTTGYHQEIAVFNELLSSAIADSFQRVERTMLESSKKLENQLASMANGAGLMSVHNAGRAYVKAAGRSVAFNYSLCRKDARDPEAQIEHIVELVGDERSSVRASYQVTALFDVFRELHAPVVYYTGPAADTERLEEELMARAEEIFAAALTVLREKLEAAMSNPAVS